MANFTKQAIKASFLKLLNQQPLNKISVRDIVEDCGINRNSFYYHFHDIPSLLGEIITDQTEQLIRAYPSISSLDECFHVAFRFALENKRAVMHIYHSVNRDMFTQRYPRPAPIPKRRCGCATMWWRPMCPPLFLTIPWMRATARS